MYYAFVTYKGDLLFVTKNRTELLNWLERNCMFNYPGYECKGLKAILTEINERRLGKKWTKEDIIEFYYTKNILLHDTHKQQKAYISYLIKKNKPAEQQTEKDKADIRIFKKFYKF